MIVIIYSYIEFIINNILRIYLLIYKDNIVYLIYF